MSYTVDAAACGLYFDSMPVAFTIIEIVVDEKQQPIDFIFRYANAALARLEGKMLHELIDKRFYRDVFPQDNDKKCLPHYFRSAFHGQVCQLNEYSREASKHLRIISYPWRQPGFCACILTDETEQKRRWDELGHRAAFDSLTRTLNQSSYHEYCEDYRPGASAGVIFIDVNGLKEYNDSFGHPAGDRLIQTVTGRMGAVLMNRPHLVFRVGGDEFAIIMEGCTEEQTCMTALELRRAFVNDGNPDLPPTLAAVGYSWGENVQNIDELLKRADAAMYANKQDHYKRKNEVQASDWQRALPRIRNMIDHKMIENENHSAHQMWKESYRIGVDRIDAQHMELFRMTDELLMAVTVNAGAEVYRKILGFLKEYVVYHFRDEEAYQQSIGYAGFEAHQREHQQFTQTVLAYEKKLIASHFALSDVKDLAGTVVAWLVYHVTDADQRIVSGQTELRPQQKNWQDIFVESAAAVVKKVSGLDNGRMCIHEVSGRPVQGDVLLKVSISGDVIGTVYFGVSKALALNVLSQLTMRRLNDVEEMVCSAICEFTEIACSRAIRLLEMQGVHCRTGTPVRLTSPAPEGLHVMVVEIEAGTLDVAAEEA